jgi:gamma-glutamyl hercynylcysteine S-oxide synthase
MTSRDPLATLTRSPVAPARFEAAAVARMGDAGSLAPALAAARERTLRMAHAAREQLGDTMPTPYDPTLNPLRWELGHVGWFEHWWITRNTERRRGAMANPACARSSQPDADALYDSSLVPQETRWSLSLPSTARIVDELAAQRSSTIALLRESAGDDDSLYFFRLALHHEHMHGEAWSMMAQQLGLDLGSASTPCAMPEVSRAQVLQVPSTFLRMQSSNVGFAFDNERGVCELTVPPFVVDHAPVTWERYLLFAERGGYSEREWWSDAGWDWLHAQRMTHPRYLRRKRAVVSSPGQPVVGGVVEGAGSSSHARTPRTLDVWQQCRFGQWHDLNPTHAATHLSYHEAQAWCRWAGRAMPTEAQWRAAQQTHPEAFVWGHVWEWTASRFEPFDGFVAHPYRDYSHPWFDGRPVLKGASQYTHAQMKHPAYRNFYLPDRNDAMAGFRTCATA